MNAFLDPLELKIISEQIVEHLKPLLAVQQQGKATSEVNEIMTIEELADFLKVPVRWLYVQVQHNTIPYIKTGKFLRFRRSQIIKHLEQSSIPAAHPLRPRGCPLVLLSKGNPLTVLIHRHCEINPVKKGSISCTPGACINGHASFPHHS